MDQHRIFLIARMQRPEQARPHHVGKADDGVQRRAQLVAHIGEEFGLDPAGGFRRLLGAEIFHQFGPQALPLQGGVAEQADGARELAELVAPVLHGDDALHVAVDHRLHRAGENPQGPDDALENEEEGQRRDRDGDEHEAQRADETGCARPVCVLQMHLGLLEGDARDIGQGGEAPVGTLRPLGGGKARPPAPVQPRQDGVMCAHLPVK